MKILTKSVNYIKVLSAFIQLKTGGLQQNGKKELERQRHSAARGVSINRVFVFPHMGSLARKCIRCQIG
jgi:hypothetical protein